MASGIGAYVSISLRRVVGHSSSIVQMAAEFFSFIMKFIGGHFFVYFG